MTEKNFLASLNIEKEDVGSRLDRILLKKFNSLSFIKVQKLIRVGFFRVNNKKLSLFSKYINNKKIKDIKPKKKTDQLNKTEKKKFQVTKYQAKSSFNLTKFLSYILDTLKPFSNLSPIIMVS